VLAFPFWEFTLDKTKFKACTSRQSALELQLQVRRVWSISLVLALCCTMVSPSWATSCMHGSTKMCHRSHVHTHDCHMDGENQEGTNSDPGLYASQSDQTCPMSCCMHSRSTAARPAVAVDSNLLLPSHSIILFVSQVFVVTGFSSHTDRGPPSAIRIG
jgi:hypothetical protein